MEGDQFREYLNKLCMHQVHRTWWNGPMRAEKTGWCHSDVTLKDLRITNRMKLEETSGGHVVPPGKLMAIQGESCLASAAVFLCENGQLRWLFTISDFAQFSLKCMFSSLLFHWLGAFSAWKLWTVCFPAWLEALDCAVWSGRILLRCGSCCD